MKPRAALLATLSILLAYPSGVRAQDLPPADELIERYVEAIGGREAHLSPSSLRTTGTVEMRAMGIRGAFELRQSLPDRMAMRIEVPGIGEILNGFDGEVGWSVNPLIGPALMEGTELAQMRERANVRAGLRDADLVPERETVELAGFEGEPCWRVRLRWASGRESFDCYSRETGLLIAAEDVQVSPMGELPVTTLFSDYREIEGMLLPTRMVQRTLGQEQEMRIEGVEVDTVDPSELDLPPPVRTLLGSPGR